MNFLYDFLNSLSFWVLFWISFFATFLIDMLYALWTRRTVEGKAKQAAGYSVLIYIFSVTAFMGILEINNVFIFPALAGAWFGTYLTIKVDED